MVVGYLSPNEMRSVGKTLFTNLGMLSVNKEFGVLYKSVQLSRNIFARLGDVLFRVAIAQENSE